MNTIYYIDPFGNEQKCRLHLTAYKNWWYDLIKISSKEKLKVIFL